MFDAPRDAELRRELKCVVAVSPLRCDSYDCLSRTITGSDTLALTVEWQLRGTGNTGGFAGALYSIIARKKNMNASPFPSIAMARMYCPMVALS